MLQCDAVCCSVLQCAAVSSLPRLPVCCSVLQRVAVCCSVLQCVCLCQSLLSHPSPFLAFLLTLALTQIHFGFEVCYSVSQCAAVCCRVLQGAAACCVYTSDFNSCRWQSMPQRIYSTDAQHHTATHCNTLQHTATHCKTSYIRVARTVSTSTAAASRVCRG